MPEYGVTAKGVNVKRLDVIMDEIHSDLSEGWGVNTRQNPESYLNVLITSFADKLAELWEFGEGVYNSMYPATAEGISLDNAAQFGGSTREVAAKSYYHVLCTGRDGTVVPQGTIIASDTNPATNLTLLTEGRITREAFNKASVIITSTDSRVALGVALNGTLYTTPYASEKSASENLQELAKAITDREFSVTVEDEVLKIEAVNSSTSNVMVLSENLTTRDVGSVLLFGTQDYGDIMIPEGVITKIVKSVPGLDSVVNVGEYIAGRLVETDEEFRLSYSDKIFNRSNTMIESIRSVILKNVQGVVSCAVYENPSHEVDEAGRYPHSVEVVVDGGDQTEIAQQILNTKAGGINTFGSVEVKLPGIYGEPITIRFNRPTPVYIWVHVGITLSKTQNPPANYVEMIKEQIVEAIDQLDAGMDVIPQTFLPKVFGIDYMDIKLHASKEAGERPSSYDERAIEISERERAETSEDRIEVALDD